MKRLVHMTTTLEETIAAINTVKVYGRSKGINLWDAENWGHDYVCRDKDLLTAWDTNCFAGLPPRVGELLSLVHGISVEIATNMVMNGRDHFDALADATSEIISLIEK